MDKKQAHEISSKNTQRGTIEIPDQGNGKANLTRSNKTKTKTNTNTNTNNIILNKCKSKREKI